MVQICNCLAFIHSCLFWWRSHYMFLDYEPEEGFQLPRSGMPLKEKKKNGYTVASDGENLHVLEFFAVGNKGKAVPFLFCQG